MGSKSSQNAFIFHKKNYGGGQKFFLYVITPEIQFLTFLRARNP